MKTKLLLLLCLLGAVPLSATFTSIKTGTLPVGHTAAGAWVFIEYDVQMEPGTPSNTCMIKVRYPTAMVDPTAYDFRVGAWFTCQSSVVGVGLRNGGGYSTLPSSQPSQSTPYTPLSASAAWITLASFQYAGGELLNLGSWLGEQIFNGGSWTWGQFAGTSVTLSASVPFKITFTIPANNTPYTRHYVAYQGTLAVGFFTQPAGAAATSVEIGPLQTNAAVQLLLITGGFVGDDGTDVPVITSETEMVGVNSGNPVAGGVTVSNTTTPAVDTPAVATDPTPTVTPPGTSITNPVAPTPTGTSAATKTDIMTMGNQVTAAIQAADGRAAGAANSTVTAINAVITAQNKTVAALDKLNAKDGGTDMTATNDLLSHGNEKLDSIAADSTESLKELKKITQPANVVNGNYDIDGAMNSAQSAGSASVYNGIKPQGTTHTTTFSGTSDGTLPSATVHVGDRDVNIGQLGAGFSGAAAMVHNARPLMLLALCVWFVWSCSSTVEKYIVGLGQIGGGGAQNIVAVENAVPGVGLAKHLASAASIVTVGLTAAAAVIALVDTIAGVYGLGVGSLLTAFNYGDLGGAVAWIDYFYPVAASTSLFILRAGVGYMVAPIYLGAASLSRFLHV